MYFFARFDEVDGHLFRFDTRIYLNDYQSNEGSTCIAAIIGKNPGSAKPSKLGSLEPLELDGDKLLPFVRNRFLQAFQIQKKIPPTNAYIQVWNLFYLCNADLQQAKDTYKSMHERAICKTEEEAVPLTWFAWGGNDAYLNQFKQRFFDRNINNPFYYDNFEKNVATKLPCEIDPVRHTQGMPAELVEIFLSKII